MSIEDPRVYSTPTAEFDGLILIQSMISTDRRQLGVASYHFEEKPYICYENAPDYWRLDNNEYFKNIPGKRKYFTDVKFHGNIFMGRINWYSENETTVNRAHSWRYCFKLSENSGRIEEGVCRELKKDDKTIGCHKFNQDLFYCALVDFGAA